MPTDDITELVKRVRRKIGARFPLAWGQQKTSGTSVMWPAVFDREGDLVAYCNTDEIQEAILAIPNMLGAIERLQAERGRLQGIVTRLIEGALYCEVDHVTGLCEAGCRLCDVDLSANPHDDDCPTVLSDDELRALAGD